MRSRTRASTRAQPVAHAAPLLMYALAFLLPFRDCRFVIAVYVACRAAAYWTERKSLSRLCRVLGRTWLPPAGAATKDHGRSTLSTPGRRPLETVPRPGRRRATGRERGELRGKGRARLARAGGAACPAVAWLPPPVRGGGVVLATSTTARTMVMGKPRRDTCIK